MRARRDVSALGGGIAAPPTSPRAARTVRSIHSPIIRDLKSRMESLEVQRRVAELIQQAEKKEALSRDASKLSAELALMAADLRRQARLLKTKAPPK